MAVIAVNGAWYVPCPDSKITEKWHMIALTWNMFTNMLRSSEVDLGNPAAIAKKGKVFPEPFLASFALAFILSRDSRHGC